jgi:uncharacterized protein YegL
MNKIKGLILAVSLFGLAACEPQQLNSKKNLSGSNVSNGSYDTKLKANAPWPPVNEEAQISDNLLSKNYYLIFDGSGSMAENTCSDGRDRLSVAKDAILTFIESIPDDANIGLFIFDQFDANERVSLSPSNKIAISNMVIKARAGGSTPLGNAVLSGYRSLTIQAQKQLGYGEYNMVVITDGSSSDNVNRPIAKVLSESPITLHTIGFCIRGNHPLNQEGLTIYKNAQNPSELTAGLKEVLAESPSFNVDSFEGS